MKYEIVHSTRYIYQEVATLCHNQAHLTPRDTVRQRALNCRLEISPAPAAERTWTDVFGNQATYYSIEQAHRELAVTSYSHVEISDGVMSLESEALPWDDAVAEIDRHHLSSEFDPCVLICRSNRMAEDKEVRQFAEKSFQPRRPLLEATLDLTARIYEEFHYDPLATSIATPLQDILRGRRGVCQDFAQLEVACFRSLGLAARYVSGYLVTRPPPGKPRLIGADATHAWVSVYFPRYGWIDFDPTNNRLVDSDFITLAWGRDYADVSPVRGVFLGGGAHQMIVSVDVEKTADK